MIDLSRAIRGETYLVGDGQIAEYCEKLNLPEESHPYVCYLREHRNFFGYSHDGKFLKGGTLLDLVVKLN